MNSTPAQLRLSLDPLVSLLQQELAQARIHLSAAPPASITAFAPWYLQAVQLLEGHVAAADAHAPMTRAEVELMCRVGLSAATLGDAIRLVIGFCAALHPRAGQPRLTQARGEAVFSLDSLRGITTTASSLVDITGLFGFLQLFQWLIGSELRVRQVRIGPVQRDDVLPFLKLFKAPVLAGGRLYTLEFPQQQLERPVVRTRSEFPAFFEVYPCGVFGQGAGDLAQQVAALLSAAAMQGSRMPGLEQVAASFELPASTFRRRLALGGSSFRELRDRSREELARAWLRREDLSVEQVAARLGFSDATAFRRAFRHWTGLSPSAWRNGK
jgi:AraC-like DNA-binding protein